MRVYEALAEAIPEAGIDVVFGLMGEGNLELISCLCASERIRYYATRHEAGAVGMADGFSRVTGAVGVCSVTQGPGFTNALTALTAAARNGSRVLLLLPDTPRGEETHPQKIDVPAVVAAVGSTLVDLTDADAAVDAFATAFAAARNGTVVFRMPNDLQKLEYPGNSTRSAPADTVVLTQALPSAAAVEAAADLIERSERLVLLAGRGAIAAGAKSELLELANRIGAVTATSLQAKGWFDEDPYGIGIFGGFASSLGTELIQEADCVLAFGASLNSWQTRTGELLDGVTVVQCDTDSTAFGRYAAAPTLALHADAAATARVLAEELARRGHSSRGFRNDDVRRRLAEHDPLDDFVDESTEGNLDPRAAVIALDRALPRDRTLVVDGGHFTGFPCMYMSVPEPAAFVFAIDFGSTGLGLGTAIGAAIGQPDRPVVLVVGDGGLMMSIAELETIGRYKLPIIIAVLNDGALSSEAHHLRIRGLPADAAYHEVPPLASVAQAVGLRGLTVATPEDLAALKDQDFESPTLIDVLIDGDVLADWFASFARRAAEAGHWT